MALCSADLQDSFDRSRAGPDRGSLRAGMRASAVSSTDVLSADNTQWEKRKRFLVTFCRLAKSYPLLGAEALSLKHQHQKHSHWIPAFAGATSGGSWHHPHPNPLPPAGEEENQKRDSSFRRNNKQRPLKFPHL